MLELIVGIVVGMVLSGVFLTRSGIVSVYLVREGDQPHGPDGKFVKRARGQVSGEWAN